MIHSILFMASLKHILTSAECLLKDVEILRSRYEETGDLNQFLAQHTSYVENCNLFALVGYDSERKANEKYPPAPLIRVKEQHIHENAFKYGYKFNIGKFISIS